MQDYYKILNIGHRSTSDEIKKAYRQAALFWHPDKNKSINAHEKFIQINEAYNILFDPQKRIVYDKLYAVHFNKNHNATVYEETTTEYKVYSDWVKEARVKAEKLATVSFDNALTDTFHFVDKNGQWIFIIIMISFILFGLILTNS